MKIRQWLPAVLLLSYAKTNLGDLDYTTVSGEDLFGYYRVSKQNDSTWYDGWEVCHTEGGHLVEINSKEEAEMLRQLMKSFQNDTCFHVGFHDLFQEGYHMGMFGLTLNETGYDDWAPGQPNNHRGVENCGSIFTNAQLNDVNCKKRLRFICEKYI